MRILNTQKSPQDQQEPSDDDLEALRQLVEQALSDPGRFVVIGGADLDIDADGNIVIRKH